MRIWENLWSWISYIVPISYTHLDVYKRQVVILTVLIVITAVIRKYSSQVTELVEERQALFKKATEQLYDSIYELNLTKNCYVGKQTEEYFKSLGAGGLPFDQGLRVIARKMCIRDRYLYVHL